MINRICTLFLLTLCISCSQTEEEAEPTEGMMNFEVIHPTQTRATASRFEANDRVGIYVTEHQVPLEVSGNYVNNALLTFNGSQWRTERPIYWNNGNYNVYAYYPYREEVVAVDDLPFEVALDQTTGRSDITPGGYEASDFLWSSRTNLTASVSPVALVFKHRMSKLNIRLIKGEDYEGEIPAEAEVYVHNTVTSATIDLSVGFVTKNPYATENTVKVLKTGENKYSAILVPQRLVNRRPLVEVVMKGVSYLVESTFVFKQGVQHSLSIVISKNPEQVKIEIGGEIENWD